MINIKYLFDDIYMVMMKKQTIFEILLHLSFILIVFLLIVIRYFEPILRRQFESVISFRLPADFLNDDINTCIL